MITAKPARKAANNTKRTAPNPALPDPHTAMRAQLKGMGLSDKQVEAMIQASVDNQ